MKRNIRFLLYGEGSFLNKGCEAIVNTTAKKVRKITDGEIILSTNDIDFDSQYYNDIINKYVKGYYREDELTKEEKAKLEYYNTIEFDYSNFERIRTKDTIKEIENCDICMSIGGDNYSYGASEWLYTINKEAKARNKKTIFWGTSIYEEINDDEMIRDLKSFDLIIPRETLTYNALTKFIDKDRLILGPDTAFSLEKKEVELPKIFKNNKKVVGINISPLVIKLEKQENNLLKSVQALIDKILKDTDYNVILIPHVYVKGNSDLDALKVIKDLYKQEERVELLGDRIYNCEELKYIISKCNYLIAARTHASIAGYSSIVPTLVIGYSVKSKGIALDLFGDYKNYVIPINEVTSDNLIEKFEFIRQNEDKIIKTLKDKMVIYKKEADELLEKAIERLEYLEEKEITHENKCTGCMACFNICPNNAIKIVQDKEGFLHPEIDDKKCTRCNLCRKICPVNKNYSYEYDKTECYAAINNEDEVRLKSSSGGIFYLIAKNVLDKKGTVYGACNGKEIKHIRIDKIQDLEKILGSKYVQSKIGEAYRKVKKDLEQKREVLFSGTPCQIEGLRNYLGGEYDNLICLSVICHGAPSTGVYERYVNEKEDKTLKSINFRDKKDGWKNYNITYNYENKGESIKHGQDLYMIGFVNDYFLRNSCYNCEMRYGKKNTADIILGDFWGIEKVLPEMDDDKGTSVIIVNSNKGKEMFENIKEDIKYEKCDIENIFKYNPMLKRPTKYTKNRDEFFRFIEKNEVETAIKMIRFKEVNEKLIKIESEVDYLNKQVGDLLEAKQYFLGQIEAKDKAIQEKERVINDKDKELEKIYNSRSWKYTNKIRKIINKIRRK